MELKAGYKQTEVGVIPEDWEVKALKEISPRQSVGLVINPSTYFDPNESIPMLVGSSVTENRIDAEAANRISAASNFKLAASRLTQGDLVTVRVGDPGVTAVVPPELDQCNCASMMIVRQDRSFNSHWLCSTMNSRHGRQQVEDVQYGTAQKQFNIKDAVNFVYAVPPLQEQNQIAKVLSEVELLLMSLEQVITKKRNIKQAAMQELLTGKRRLPGFEGEWEVKRLGDHVRFLKNGVNSRAELYPGACVRYLHYGDIHASSGSFLSPQDLTGLPVDKATGLDRLQDGDLIFADASEDIAGVSRSVELCGTSDLEAVSGLHTIAARFDKSILADGFKGFLQYVPSFSKQLRRLAAGTKVYATSRAHISSAEVRLPPVAEQKAIAEVLMDMSNEIGVLREHMNKACSTKQGMIQQLLTGKIRLT